MLGLWQAVRLLGTVHRATARTISSLLALIVAVAPCQVEARLPGSPQEPAPPPGRAIDPGIPTAVPSQSAPPIPAPPIPVPRVIDDREEYIEHRLRRRIPRPLPEPAEEPSRGLGLIIPGAALVVPAALGTVLGFYVRGITAEETCWHLCEDRAGDPNPYSGTVAFTFAAISFVASAALLTAGVLRNKQWQAWKARQPPPPPEPPPSLSSPSPKRGIGMMITGGALAGPAAIYFTALLGEPGSSWPIADDPTRVFGFTLGGLCAAAGITLLAIGARRHVKYKQWKHRQAFVPTTGRTAYGTWTAGLALRF